MSAIKRYTHDIAKAEVEVELLLSVPTDHSVIVALKEADLIAAAPNGDWTQAHCLVLARARIIAALNV